MPTNLGVDGIKIYPRVNVMRANASDGSGCVLYITMLTALDRMGAYITAFDAGVEVVVP